MRKVAVILVLLLLAGELAAKPLAVHPQRARITAVTVATNGDDWSIQFSQPVTGNAGFSVDLSGGACTLSYVTGSGTNTLNFTGSRTIQEGETGTVDYAPGDLVTTTNGRNVWTRSGIAVTNNSTAGGGGEFAFGNDFNTESESSPPDTWAVGQTGATITFPVSSGAAQEGANGLSSTASSSGIMGWVYPPDSAPHDVDVSIDYLTGSPFMGVFARGSNLNTSTPTCYAAVGATSPTVRLYKIVSGTATQLATITFSGLFGESNFVGTGNRLRLTLRLNGSNIRVRLYRYSTDQYFRLDGAWSVDSDPDNPDNWCINLTDTSIVSGSGFGVWRHSGTTATGSLDLFAAAEVSGVDGTPPTLAITAPSESATLTTTGDVAVSTAGTPERVEYYVDSTLRHVAYDSPYTWELDPTIVDNGSRSISAVAVDAAGNRSTTDSVGVTVSVDRTVTLPSLTAKKSWAGGLYGYAGSGNPIGTGGTLLNTSWDDRVSNWWDQMGADNDLTDDMLAFDAMIGLGRYSNVTNIYLNDDSPLLDWLEYADHNSLDRERAFFHVAGPAWSFTASWASGQRAERFTVLAHDGASYNETIVAATSSFPAVTFPGTGETLYLGYPDPFGSARFTISTPNSGYTYAVEYCSGVATDPSTIGTGRVANAWTDATGIGDYADSTSVFTTTGEITFTPPAGWRAARLADSFGDPEHKYMYWIRIRTTGAGSTLAQAIPTTHNFDGAGNGAGGTPTNTVTFQPWDGFASWAKYQSRVPYGFYGTWRLDTNMADAEMRAWAIDYVGRVKNRNTDFTALFFDNHSGTFFPLTSRRYLREPINGFTEAQSTLTGLLWQTMGAGKWVYCNVSGGQVNDILSLLRYNPGIWYEAYLKAMEDTPSTFVTIRNALEGRSTVETYEEFATPPIQLTDLRDSALPLEDHGTVDTGSEAATTTGFRGDTNLDDNNSYVAASVKGWLHFTSGANTGEARQIDTYTTSTRKFTFASAFSNTPAHGDNFYIDLVDPSTGAWATPGTSHALESTPNAGGSNLHNWTKPQMRRLQEAAAAYYYCVYQPGMRAGLFVDTPSGPRNHHDVFFGYDVGAASEAAPTTAWATGTDGVGGTYTIYKRDFANARVLFRPRATTGSSRADDAISAAESLGGNYKRLQVTTDGTAVEQGPTITTIQLRNGEGAILVPQP